MRGSLYDRYQLSNSTAIPQYQGSAGKEFIQVGDFMQGKYDQNLGQALALNSGLESMDTQLPQDKAIADELRSHYSGKLQQLSKSGDWENMMPQVTQLGSEFANRYRELVAPMQQRAEWKKQLDEKDNNLTSQQKSTLLRMADNEYQGLRRDNNGRLVGQYSGTRIDKNIDVNERVDKWMKDAAVQSGGTIKEGSNGEWLIKNGVKWDVLTPKHIQQIIQPAAANDQEFQGYSDMMGRINSFGLDKISPEQLKDGPYKQQAIKLAEQQGIPFSAALQKVVYNSTSSGVLNNALAYGTTKYAKNNRWTDQGLSADPYGVEKFKDKLTKDFTPTMIQGANTKPTNDEQDPVKLQQIATDLKSQSSDLDGKITRLSTVLNDKSKNLSPDERTQLQSDLNNAIIQQRSLNEGVERSNNMLNYSKMRTAQNMGYSSYDEFLNTQSKDLVPTLKKQVGAGLISKSGVKITPEDLSKAILDGRVNPKFVSSGFGNTLSGLEITLPNGHKVITPAGDKGLQIYNTMLQAQDGKTSRLKQFNDEWQKQHQSNIENYSVKDNVMTLDDTHTKDFTNALKAASDGVKFKKVGEYGELSESDRPADYRVTGLGTPGPNGEARLMVEEVDAKGKPTGNKYEANALNSNINEKMARIYGKQPTPEARQAAAILTTGSPATMLKGQPLGARIPVGQGMLNGKAVNAHIVVSGTSSDPEYNLTDEEGNIINTTKSIGTAGQWINAIKKGQ